MQHLTIEPIEFVPVETGSSFVDALEAEHLRCLLQGEAFLHTFRYGPAQQSHVVGDGFCRVAHAAEVIDGGHPIALRELAALSIENQRRVRKCGLGQIKGFVKQQLLGGIGDVIFSADHMGDGHGCVIHHHHQVVKRISDLISRCPSGDHHVAPEVGAAPTHRSAHQILPENLSVVIDLEADDRLPSFGLERGFLFRREVAMSVVVSRSLIGGFLGLAHRLQLLFTGVAAIGEAFVEQGLNRCSVLIHPLALDDGVLIPVDPEPLQTFKDVAGEFRFGPLFVGVFDAQKE